MKGYEYVHYMTLKEWKQWEENFRNDGINKQYDVSIKRFLKEEFFEFYRFIAWSFVGQETPQGRDYWKIISERTKPLTQCKEKII